MFNTSALLRKFYSAFVLLEMFSLAQPAAHGQAYAFVNSFGGYGNGNGQFNTPCFITFDNNNNLYVSDTFNSRVEKFTHAGVYQGTIGSPGTGGGQFTEPLGLTINNGNLYVADYIHSATANGRIEEFSGSGTFIKVAAVTQPLPYGLASDPTGYLYVAVNHSYIEKFGNSSTVIKTIGSPGSGNGELSDATGIRFDDNSNLYIADMNNGRIAEFDSNGNFHAFGNGYLSSPADVAIDPLGNIYASDYASSQIAEYDKNGNFVQYIGAGQLLNPYGITFDYLGNLFVVDRGHNRIVEFDRTANVASVALTPATVASGGSTTGMITLSAPAPSGGFVISLNSSNPSIASVPASITVLSGGIIAYFTVTASPVSATSTASITATFRGSSANALATIQPAQLSSLKTSPGSVLGGVTATGTVALNGKAPAGGAQVILTNSNPSIASFPGSVTVPAGATTTTFTVTTIPNATTSTTSITAAYQGLSISTDLTVQTAQLSNFVLAGSSVIGGVTATGTVTLNGKAPAGGTQITLTNSNPSIANFPGSVTVPAGATTTTFTITTNPLTSTSTTSITASLGSTSLTQKLTVNPPRLSGFSLSPSSLVGGGTTIGTVTLNGLAPAGGAQVILTNSTPSILNVPGSVTVPAGATTATFTITSSAPTVRSNATITASFGGTSLSTNIAISIAIASLVLNPTTVQGGSQNSTATITLTGIAPLGGMNVTLTSSATNIASVPATINVPYGSATVTFTVTSKKVTAMQTPSITAAIGPISHTAILTVTP